MTHKTSSASSGFSPFSKKYEHSTDIDYMIVDGVPMDASSDVIYPGKSGNHEVKLHFNCSEVHLDNLFNECTTLLCADFSLLSDQTVSPSLKRTFRGCTNLSSITWWLTKKSITDFSNAFNGCKSLPYIEFSEYIDYANATTFELCFAYGAVNFPGFDGVSLPKCSNMSGMFTYNTGTTRFSWPTSVSSSGCSADYIFSNCNKLETITNPCPSKITNLSGAFEYVNTSSTIDLSKIDEVVDLSYAFAYGYTPNIEFPPMIGNIERMFCQNSANCAIDLSGSWCSDWKSDYAFQGSNVTGVIMPVMLCLSYDSTFKDCVNLKYADLTYCGLQALSQGWDENTMQYMFHGCKSLKKIFTNIHGSIEYKFNTDTHPHALDVFNKDVPSSCVLYRLDGDKNIESWCSGIQLATLDRYIESSGKAVISVEVFSGFYGSLGVQAIMSVPKRPSGATYIFGADTYKKFAYRISSSATKVCYDLESISETLAYEPSTNVVKYVLYQRGSFYLNDYSNTEGFYEIVDLNTNTRLSGVISNECKNFSTKINYLSGKTSSGSTVYSPGKIYYIEQEDYYSNNYLVPYVKNGVAGMIDLEYGDFISSSTSTAFTYVDNTPI